MPGRQLGHPIPNRLARRHEAQSEVIVKRLPVEGKLQASATDQSLDLAGEIEPASTRAYYSGLTPSRSRIRCSCPLRRSTMAIANMPSSWSMPARPSR